MLIFFKTSTPIPLSMKWRGVHPEGFTLKGNKGGKVENSYSYVFWYKSYGRHEYKLS